MTNPLKITVTLLLLFLTSNLLHGQLGFCDGSKGIPIFIENFGNGTSYGPQLPTGVTSYTYIAGTPQDGQYTLYYRTNQYSSWHNSPDRTPDNEPNGVDGKSLIVNASFTSNEFYKRTVTGLCVNTTFEFSAWVMNVYNAASTGACPGSGIPINVTFEIWDTTETTLLQSGSTNSIAGTTAPIWNQFGLVFTTGPGQSSVVLKMRNNGAGGCGNDLAIDDIMFRSCGDYTNIETTATTGATYTVCQDAIPINITMEVNSNGTTTSVYQWQQSTDNILWTDITGENAVVYSTPSLISDRYYRVKVAQDLSNFNNEYCSTISDIFSIILIPKPIAPISNGDKTICNNDPIPELTVTTDSGNTVAWFDAPAGGNLLLNNSDTFVPINAGTYYAEAYIQNYNCKSPLRTPVTFTIKTQPIGISQDLILCENQSIELDAGITNVTYAWSTGESTKTITISSRGIYTVTVTNPEGCSNTKTITVTEKQVPIITGVAINGATVTILTAVSSDYEYSLDNINYQSSNVFNTVSGGLHTAYVREINACGEDQEDFLLLKIPHFFTPNNDGFNDFFRIEGLEFIPNAHLSVFDRYGKLITIINSGNTGWDGNFKQTLLPGSDYWYQAVLENGKELRGHFSLKR